VASKGKWITWNELKLNRNLPISFDLQTEVFDRDELTRLNCVNKKAMIHALAPDTTDHQVFIGLDDFFFVETRSTKMAKYFTDFFLAYRTNLLLVGCPQQGKSSLISTSLR
jgi:hypothetical protein